MITFWTLFWVNYLFPKKEIDMLQECGWEYVEPDIAIPAYSYRPMYSFKGIPHRNSA
jgi:hypothetical protein